MLALPAKTRFVDNRTARATAAIFAILIVLFNPIWITLRFSEIFGRFLWMQAAYDEPFYFGQLVSQIQSGAIDINYRLFSKILAAILLPFGVSFDALLTIYGVLNPLACFGAALVLASIWERRSLGRVVWALILIFSFDVFSGSSTVVYESAPAMWLENLVGDQSLLRADTLSFFLINRRPEPQSSWIILFLYWALLLKAFLHDDKRTYRLTCLVTPFLAFIYINAAVVAILLFTVLSVASLAVHRRFVLVPFMLALSGTILTYALSYALGSTSAIVAQTVFSTHYPILRPSVAFSIIGLLLVLVRGFRRGPNTVCIAAAAFLAMPTIVLNQQIVTGVAIMPQNWELYVNYPCLVVGVGLLSGQMLSSLERRTDPLQFLSVGLLMLIGYFVIHGTLRNEAYWTLPNVRSVLFAESLKEAQTKVDRIEGVVLPHIFDESMFLTRIPPGTAVLGGFSMMIDRPAPVWRKDESFEDHALRAKASFNEGFETLFRSGVSPHRLETLLRDQLSAGDCWLGLSYFFALTDCWPRLLNYTTGSTHRMATAIPRIVAMYRHYIQNDSSLDVARRRMLLIRNEPASADMLIRNRLVATTSVKVHGSPVEAFAYVQTLAP
jgi:hypothetical protein